MRNAFADEITKLAALDPRVVLLSGDIGNNLFNKFKANAPTRFYNCGVAEANMVGMAAGLAMSGLRPVAYTITPFLVSRTIEQIRVDVCYHDQPVVLVGVGGGFSYARLGATHHSCEEVAMLRMLPNMSVVCPGDAWEVRGAIRAALRHPGPVYIRIGKKGEPVVHAAMPDFQLGRGIVLREGSDVCLLSTGALLPEAAEAARRLGEAGVSTEVVSLHTVKPLDLELVHRAFERFGLVVTVEEHSRDGGLGGSVAEVLADAGTSRCRLLRIGSPDEFFHETAEQEHVREHYGLDATGIVRKVSAALASARALADGRG